MRIRELTLRNYRVYAEQPAVRIQKPVYCRRWYQWERQDRITRGARSFVFTVPSARVPLPAVATAPLLHRRFT